MQKSPQRKAEIHPRPWRTLQHPAELAARLRRRSTGRRSSRTNTPRKKKPHRQIRLCEPPTGAPKRPPIAVARGSGTCPRLTFFQQLRRLRSTTSRSSSKTASHTPPSQCEPQHPSGHRKHRSVTSPPGRRRERSAAVASIKPSHAPHSAARGNDEVTEAGWEKEIPKTRRRQHRFAIHPPRNKIHHEDSNTYAAASIGHQARRSVRGLQETRHEKQIRSKIIQHRRHHRRQQTRAGAKP